MNLFSSDPESVTKTFYEMMLKYDDEINTKESQQTSSPNNNNYNAIQTSSNNDSKLLWHQTVQKPTPHCPDP
jgi:hypothetical protein